MKKMFNAQKLKITACALTGLMTFSAAGLSAGSAEAASHTIKAPHYQELSHKHDKHHRHDRERDEHKNRNTHSQGDVNTAAIVGVAVGAIAGAVIANNT